MTQRYEQWVKNPTRFLSMTGLTVAEFERLLPRFELVHDEYLSKHEISGLKKRRFRRFVIYANSPLSSHAERLCFVLYFLKHNPVQEAQAVLFEMDSKPCNEYIHGLHHILRLTLKSLDSMPSGDEKAFESKLKTLKDKELVHDATEREIPRPQDSEAQKENYSGKKKKHTVKNAIIATMTGLILFVSPTYAGKVHDKRIAETYRIPPGFILWQDTGYQGYEPEGVLIVQPTKKPKGLELTKDQKMDNRDISSHRVRIEHFIGGVKRFRIVKDECRARKNSIVDRVIGTCAGLYNLRIRHNPPQYDDNQ